MNTHALLEHWFWLALTVSALVWYSTVTVYVAIRGLYDIRTMFRRLSDSAREEAGRASSANSRSR